MKKRQIGLFLLVEVAWFSLIVIGVLSAKTPDISHTFYVKDIVGQLGGATNAVAVHGDNAYIGVGPRLVVLDITTDTPTVVWQSSILPGVVNDVVVSYATADVYVSTGWSGVYVFDGRFPGHLKTIIPNPTNEEARGIDVLDISEDYFLYVTYGSSGLYIYDITNGYDLEGSYDTDGFASDVVAVDGWRAYVADGSNGLVYVVTVDPKNPALCYTLDTPGFARNIDDEGLYVYLADGDGGLSIFGIGDWAPLPCLDRRPGLVARFTEWPAYDVDVVWPYAYVVGDYSYVTQGYGKLLVLDVTEQDNPYKVSDFDLPGETVGVAHAYAKRRAYIAGGGNSFANSGGGLHVIDVSNRTMPVHVGSYNTSGGPKALKLAGDTVYQASGNLGIRIIDTSDPADPAEIGFYDTAGDALNIDAQGDYVYVADDFTGLRVVDVSTPTVPIEVGFYDPGRVYNVVVSGAIAYVNDDDGLRLVDVTHPSTPTVISSLPITNWIGSITVAANHAFLTTGSTGVYIVDVSQPITPSVASVVDTPGATMHVAVDGNYAYVADGNAGLRIFDISTPTTPIDIAVYDPAPFVRHVFIYGNFAYLATPDGLSIIDIRDPTLPTHMVTYDTPGMARMVIARDNLAYVGDGPGGLAIFALPPWFAPPTTASVPTTGGALNSPGDGTSYTFPSGTFSVTVIVTHTPEMPASAPSPGELGDIGHFYDVTAAYADSGLPVQPVSGKTYTVTISYKDDESALVLEDTLALYGWDGNQWVKEATSTVDVNTNTVTVTPNHFSLWALLGRRKELVFLPTFIRNP